MQEVGAFEAKNNLSALLDQVEQGEEIVITRRGRPVARLVSPMPGGSREQAAAAAARIRERARGVTLGGLTLKDLIAEGRP